MNRLRLIGPTFGSLFSGIGGLDLGLERAGWQCRWQVEIDAYCRRVLAKHWPAMPRHADIRALTGGELEDVDLVAGGFPCQPISLAGRRRGKDDDRWLWPEFARLVGELRPRYVCVENVPGLLTQGMGEVLGDLSALGYDAEWQTLPAAAFGAPQLRYRVWIVAYNHRNRCREWPDQPECQSQSGEPADPRQGSQTLAGPHHKPIFRTVLPWPANPPWTTEPEVGRVALRIPRRVDRLRALGNAVVPVCAEYIGRLIRGQLEEDVGAIESRPPR